MDKTINCCFTGYRPHKFGFEFSENNQEYVKLENKLIDAVFSLADEGCYKFYCGMAMGFDLLAAESVIMLKKLYKKAKAGEISHFTGIDSPYEEPKTPDLVLDTQQWDEVECVEMLLGAIASHGEKIKE